MVESAFPTFGGSPFDEVAQGIEIEERGSHIPARYVRNPHTDPENTVVKEDGVPLLDASGSQFVVSQVAPERRYAIKMDGNVFPVHEFTEMYKQAHLEWYAIQRKKNPNVRFDGNIDLIAVPHPAYFVKWRIDPRDSKKLLEIGFDPDKRAEEKPDYFVDGEGERVAGSRIEHLCACYKDPSLRGRLTASETLEVQEYLGESVDSGPIELATKLEQLTDLMNDGSISLEVYAKKVAALTGKAPETDEKEPEPVNPNQARCGKVLKPGGRVPHELRCLECKRLFAEDENALKEPEDDPPIDD